MDLFVTGEYKKRESVHSGDLILLR